MKQTMLLLSIFLLATLISGWVNLAEAQQAPHIGIMIRDSGQSESDTVKGLRDGLKGLGYLEGKNILIEVRNARGDRRILKSTAVELVGKKIDLIFTTGTAATLVAMAATTEIPIVFRHPLDPVALGLVKSMDRPGGNVTGVAALSVQNAEKRLEILKEIVPTLRRVLIFYDHYNPISRVHFAIAEKAATKLGLEVAEYSIKNGKELRDALNRFKRREGDALYHVSDVLVQSQAEYIFKVARQKRLPTMFGRVNWAARGSLAGYGPNYYEMGRQAASVIEKILKGARPGSLPIERANKFDLYINLRTASIIRVKVPPEVLKRADKVIR